MLEDKEFRVITRQETFSDLAVRELAKSKAACMCRQQFGRCKSHECKSCSIYREYENCREQLSDYDKNRLSTYVAEYYVQYSATPDQWLSHKRFISYYIKFCLAAMIGAGLFAAIAIGLCSLPHDKPTGQVTLKDKIINVIILEQQEVYDHNKDGLINCIDYACAFKETWDKTYPQYKTNCVIVRNLNPLAGMHHLFIRVYLEGQVIDVEPWTDIFWKYDMKEVWGKRYNSDYNYYGETRRWLMDGNE